MRANKLIIMVAYVSMILLVGIMFSGCGGYKLVKHSKEAVVDTANTFTVKIGENRNMSSILNDIMGNGELVNKDVHARNFGGYEYTWEMWLIKEATGDFHAVIIENGTLQDISPVNNLEDAQARFKPYGGWKH